MDLQVYIDEHKELYQKLECFLSEFTMLKNKRDDEFLIKISKPFYEYIEVLLNQHFKEEEEKLFPDLKNKMSPEILARIIHDHIEIREKFEALKVNMEAFKLDRNLDYKAQILFPSYNLIATINHHAQREDLHIFNS
jgi:iron-sulfur cluster repair protein YtfE (RIC family)